MRFLKEHSNEFMKEFDDFESVQFEDLSATVIQEMDKEEASVIPSSTKLTTEREAKKFKNFLIENNLSDKLNQCHYQYYRSISGFTILNFKQKMESHMHLVL